MLAPAADYDSLVAAFRWQIPQRYNIAFDVCDRWAAREPDRAAVLDVAADGRVTALTYGELRERSNRLANALRARGIAQGDRVAILLPQGPAVPVRPGSAYKPRRPCLPPPAPFRGEAHPLCPH